MYNDYLISSSRDDFEKFKLSRRSYQSLFRKKKINFYLNQTAKNLKSSKKFWEFYSSSVKLKKDLSNILTPQSILTDEGLIQSPEEISNAFNNHFTNLASEEGATQSESSNFINKIFINNPELMPKKDISFDFRPTNSIIIEKIILDLDSASSAGMMDIPVTILKAVVKKISPFFAQLFNDCIKNKVFPNELKVALVTPLFKKKGAKDNLNYYRGISILPPMAKVFEKILAEQIRIFFNVNNLFCSSQHGFRASHSCETALHELISKCLTAFCGTKRPILTEMSL